MIFFANAATSLQETMPAMRMTHDIYKRKTTQEILMGMPIVRMLSKD